MKKKIIAFWLLCAATSVWAQTNFMTETETNCYLQHKDEIDTRSEMASEDKFRELTTTYSIKLTYEAELRNICNILEMRKVICDYLHPKDHKKRFWIKKEIEDNYRSSIDRIVILSGNDVSSPSMTVLFKFSDYIKLTTNQVDTLVETAIFHKQILKTEPRKNMWKEELTMLQSILTEEQLDRFFNQKNSRLALRSAVTHWNRLQENGLTNDLDSVKSVNQMYVHILKKQKAADIYFNDDSQKRKAWAEIDQSAPLAMNRSYEIARRSVAKKQLYRGTFNW